MTVELVGTVTQSVGREVMSATLDIGDGMARPLTITGTTWRVTVPLAQVVEETRSFTLSALDASTQTTTTMVSVRIDTLGPRTALTVPAAGTVVGGMAALQGTATDGASPLMLVTVDVGGGPQMASVAMSGAWQVTVTFPPNLDRVMRTATIRATDLLGNQSTQTAQILVDTQGPTLALTSPASGTAVGAAATLSGTTNDSTGPVSGMTVDIGSGPQMVTVQANGTWSAMVTFPPNLDRVSRTVTLRAQDSLGNVTQTTAQVLVDTQGPTLAFTAPASMERLGNPRTQAVTGSVGDGSGVASVQVNCADGVGNRTATVTSGSWSFSWMLPTSDNSSFVCTATATDSLANATVVTRTFFVDTVGPVVTILNPASAAILGGPAQSTVQVQANVTDGSGALGTVNLSLGSTTVPATGSAGVFSNTFTLPVVDFQSVSVTVVALDAEGNTTSSSRSVTVDKVAPVVAFTAPSIGQTFNIASFPTGNDVQMTWTVTDGDPMAGTRNFNGSAVAAASRTAPVQTSASDNGVTYSRSVDAIDRAGNISSPATRSFSVDRVRPTVVSILPLNDSRMNDATRARVVFSEPIAGSLAVVRPSALELNGVLATGDWVSSTTYESQNLPGGSVYQCVVVGTMTDNAGNPVVSTSWRFHRALQPPLSDVVVSSVVGLWDVSVDPDGQPTVAFVEDLANMPARTATLTGAGVWALDQGNLAIPALPVFPDLTINSWGTIGPDLRLSRLRALYSSGAIEMFADDSIFGGAASTSFGIAVVTPPIDPLDGNAPIGLAYSEYTRSPNPSVTLPFTPQRLSVAPEGWFGFRQSGSTLSILVRDCRTNTISGVRECGVSSGTVSSVFQTVSNISSAIGSNRCGMVAFTNGSGNRLVLNFSGFLGTGVFVTGLTYTGVAAPGPFFSVARRPAGGLYGAWQSSTTPTTTTFTIATTTTCNQSGWASLKTITVSTGLLKAQVAQVGNAVGIIYQLADGLLRIAF